jgi:hypothetical protein
LLELIKLQKKQAGISFILIDLKQPNIEIKPIQLLSGQSPFCQVFFDNILAKESHRVAPENDGWKVAKRLLQFERTMMADMESEGAVDIEPLEVLRSNQALDSPGCKSLHRKICKHEMRNNLIEITMTRTAIESQNGFAPSALTLKYLSTEETQQRWELNVASLGMGGLEIVDRSDGVKKEVSKSFFLLKSLYYRGRKLRGSAEYYF